MFKFYFYQGVIGIKLYHRNSAIETIEQTDVRVITQKEKLSGDHLAELNEVRGKTLSGEILFFPEDGFYAYTRCPTCKMTAPMKEKVNICTTDGCGGVLKNCYKVDIKFITTKTDEVFHLTGFDEVFSPYERKSSAQKSSGQSLEARFKKLMGRALSISYKTSLKRNAAGESSLYIESIKIMD